MCIRDRYTCILNWFGEKQLSLNLPTFCSSLLLIGFMSLPFTQVQAQGISFSKTTLSGTNLSEPTSLDFGPDGRLYVSERTGSIYAYTVDKIGNSYQVLATEIIDLVKDIPNHNDVDGALNFFEDERQVIGILVVGTATNPIIYASSSDVRIGGGGGSCLLYTSPSPRDLSTSRMPSSA